MSFVKSIWVKCISCLLAIALVSGGLLAILSNVLYVSSEERTSRAMTKIYGTEIEVKEDNIIVDIDSDDPEKSNPIVSSFGEIEKIYKLNENGENFDMVFQSKGSGGYKGGTITLWVKVVFENATAKKIDKVILQTYEKQTLMSKLGGDFYSKFTLDDVTEEYINGKIFTSDSKDNNNIQNVVSNASMSANAASNAVNCVLNYIWGNN